MAEVRKQPVEKSHELLDRSEFLAIGDRNGVISIEKKRRGETSKKGSGKQASERDGNISAKHWVKGGGGNERMGAQSGSQNHRQSRRENEPGHG